MAATRHLVDRSYANSPVPSLHWPSRRGFESENQALVFGASGISGWAICKNLLSYPTEHSFARVTGLTNRPLSIDDAGLPDDPRLYMVSGIDLTKDVEVLKKVLLEGMNGVECITHVYYTAYTSADSPEELKRINTQMLETAITAVEAVSPNLKFVVLQTGGKSYGVEFPKEVEIKAPLKECRPRIPKPWADQVFYYSQVDLIDKLSTGKAWAWCEVRPDVITGFVPNNNIMNIAQPLALYFSLYRHLNGPNAKVVFPGTAESWKNTHTDTSQDILARFSIHVSLHPDQTDGEAFNIADSSTPTTWSRKWPAIASYFGLEGVGPSEDQDSETAEKQKFEPGPHPGEYIEANKAAWESYVSEKKLKSGRFEGSEWDFVMGVLKNYDFDREFSLEKSRSVGFKEVVDTVRGYEIAFAQMRKVGIIA